MGICLYPRCFPSVLRWRIKPLSVPKQCPLPSSMYAEYDDFLQQVDKMEPMMNARAFSPSSKLILISYLMRAIRWVWFFPFIWSFPRHLHPCNDSLQCLLCQGSSLAFFMDGLTSYHRWPAAFITWCNSWSQVGFLGSGSKDIARCIMIYNSQSMHLVVFNFLFVREQSLVY